MYRLQRHILVSPFRVLKIKGNRTDIIDFLSLVAAVPWWCLNFFFWIVLAAPLLFDLKWSQSWYNYLGILWIFGGFSIYELIFGWPHFSKALSETRNYMFELNSPQVTEATQS